MLIVSRKRGQSIMIGDQIEVRVTDIGEGKVRLGIMGPTSLSVHRRERRGRSEVEPSHSVTKAPRVLAR